MIEVIEVSQKRDFAIIRVGNIYLHFKKFPGGKIRIVSRWKYSRGDTNFYLSPNIYSEVVKRAAAILLNPKKENKEKNSSRQIDIEF